MAEQATVAETIDSFENARGDYTDTIWARGVSMSLLLRQVVGDIEPGRLRADEDVEHRANPRVVDQRSHPHVKEPAVAHEPHERHAEMLGDLDGQARWRGHRTHDRDPRDRGLDLRIQADGDRHIGAGPDRGGPAVR